MSEQIATPITARPSLSVVEWNEPADELVGLARVAAAAVARGVVHPPAIGFAAPNRTWALQLQQACTAQGLPAVLVNEPLERGVRRASIMDFRTAWDDNFDILFLLGCVEGLIPTAQALEDENALTTQREAVTRLMFGQTSDVVLSTFTRVEAVLADQIHLPYSRTKIVNGTPFARVTPTRFIAELGAARPSTISGQQFLRDAGLN